ncbi:MAG: winged helix-turn-helix transcriptional regulator [Candidatus Krumholzibacteriota bacterium]|nr:winged helix-turn-helix transcriptional regulator [Candidatus Krumholzibacteriota bacterium]
MISRKTRSPLSDGDLERLAEILKALANPARLKLVNILAGGERTVSELCELSGLKQSLVSQQLKNLRLNSIVKRRKDVPNMYYSIQEKNVIALLGCLGRCECSREANSRRIK